MFRRFSDFLRGLLVGRYGVDDFARVLTIVALSLSILGALFSFSPLIFLAFLVVCFSLFRMFSRNFEKRRKEDEWFKNLLRAADARFSLLKKRFRDRKTKRYRRCPCCKRVSSLPLKKGNFTLICPNCKTKFKVKIRF